MPRLYYWLPLEIVKRVRHTQAVIYAAWLERGFYPLWRCQRSQAIVLVQGEAPLLYCTLVSNWITISWALLLGEKLPRMLLIIPNPW